MPPLYTLTECRTGEIVSGLMNQPASNAAFVFSGLASIGDSKDWRQLDVGESATVQDKRGDVYRITRTI